MKMKKILAVLLCIAMMLSMSGLTVFADEADIWDGTSDTNWYNSEIPQESYTIDSAEELAGLAELVNGGVDFDEVKFTLTTDIDLANKNWTPIGLNGSHANEYSFRGYFDGSGKTINNLSIVDETSTEEKLGLFGHIHGNGMNMSVEPSVKDLILTNVNIKSADASSRIGALAGNPYTCYIKNVDVEGTIIGGKWTGGVAGNCYTVFESCTFTGTINSNNQAGGIAGAGDARSYNCRVYGDISATYWAGGIVGNGQEGASAVGCYVEGNISASSNWYRGVGGIAGVAGHGYSSSVFENNYFNGEVYLEGEKIDVPVIGIVNVNSNDDIKTTVKGNSWNTEKYPADLLVPVVGEVGSNATDDEYLAGSKEEIKRNNNLVMLESDLAYVDAEKIDDVIIMEGSNITSEQVEEVVQNRALPNAIVENLGAITVDKYRDYGNGGLNGAECTNPITLPVAMEFVAKDTVEEAQNNAYADYITDFFIKIEGLENGSFIANDCYLAGHYGDWGWYKIPIDGLEVQNGVIYPVITPVGAGFTYAGICEWVKKFTCGMYLSDKVLDENPDIKVTLSLGLSKTLEKAQAGDFITVDKAYTYGYADFKNEKPEIASYSATDAGYYKINGEKSGLIRFLFGFDTEETNIETGVRFIKDEDITAQVGETKSGTSKAFSADITGIKESSDKTYYAVAFLKVNPDTDDEKVYWSEVSSCTPNFERFFGTKEQ